MMKGLLKLAVVFLIAYVFYRLVSEYLRPTRVTLDEYVGAVPPYRQPPPPIPTPPSERPEQVDLNQADVSALTALPGVGPALAQRIIALRQQLGTFSRLDDLTAVPGIGPVLVERLRPLVRV